MYIYNVTVKIDKEKAADWLSWIQEKHGAEVVNTGCFTHFNLHQLIEPQQDDSPTYVVQYHAPSMADYERYVNDYAPQLKQEGIDKFGDSFVAFRSILKKIE
jgi:hypothetical protein